ncbi:MAG: outer membrane protein assembly factor BamD [SAR86 cluster bacterium]|uniref:Outer membrane protein assembly factor BamD n=1 Tax=SAR86 cluster bacterium TaxID=2030880 RepID=A0A2A4MJB6_9GAMM|nr:MAG: outer membrane protein assembly factor BamD [SAR86 cluster bacterium]
MLAVLCLSLASCNLFNRDRDRDEFTGLSTEEQFYRRALEQLNSQNFLGAISTYQALESRFPFGRFAEQAQIELVYGYYRNNNLEAARAAADRFIRLHPESPNVDYAYYMKGLASFTENGGLVRRFIPIDPTKRDPGRSRESFTEFSQLLALFPDSAYAPDARARMIYLRNNLAAYEIHVANYYMERRAYVAALRRGQYVVENFQGTPAVANGIAVMIESYLRMGLNDLADTSLVLLRENYPQHASLDGDEFIIRTEITNPSLLYTASFGLLGDNTVQPPLAPTARPRNSGSQEIINAQDRDQANNVKRSWFSLITFGIFD